MINDVDVGYTQLVDHVLARARASLGYNLLEEDNDEILDIAIASAEAVIKDEVTSLSGAQRVLGEAVVKSILNMVVNEDNDDGNDEEKSSGVTQI